MNERELENPSSWLDWFLLRESAGKINSSSKLQLFKTFDASKDEENTKQYLYTNKILVRIN